ncbi:hypothetical protein [Mycolicibacterium sphagni]|uniref:Chitin-binding protein n=1 Tax=Mycolicibacterium sphagni TaxID=1786 RepID=A0A255DP60_9MYCO|nr:hypothetical protein [Mycolicibacterium sphagni]MCV7180017.1 hypothetical protein [Mycolicibacterium sphagni]OYN80890.1 hypothetical protein CG716_08235 [Mycolicibacterium sphagni]
MSITKSTRIAAVAVGITIAGLTVGAAPALAEPGPGGQCGFQGCQGPGQRGPEGPGQDRRDPGPADWRGGPGGGPSGQQWRGGDDRGWRGGDDRGWQPGPPPQDLGWRGIDQGRWDHQPFNYGGNWVNPVFDQGNQAWGFWLFGVWIPL